MPPSIDPVSLAKGQDGNVPVISFKKNLEPRIVRAELDKVTAARNTTFIAEKPHFFRPVSAPQMNVGRVPPCCSISTAIFLNGPSREARMPIQTTAELFRLTDDGSGGMVQTLKRRIKLHLRAWLERQPLQQVAQTLAHPELRCLPVFDPQLLLRPLRSYLWNGLNASQRAQAFSAHFAWLRHAFDETDIDTLYNLGRLEVCTMAAAPGCLDIALTPGRGLGREGELELHLSLNGVLLLRAAFCILPAELLEAGTTAPGGRVMVIGSVQGCAGRAEGMRALTHATHRSRPKALLLDVLQGLSAGLHIDALLGVSTRSHVYGRYHSLSKRVGVDYDQMWQELGATQRLGHHWLLPAAPMLRPPHEVPSRKRAEHRRRSEFRQTLYVLACTRATSIAAKTWRGQHASTLVERCSDEGPVLTSRCQVDHIQR